MTLTCDVELECYVCHKKLNFVTNSDWVLLTKKYYCKTHKTYLPRNMRKEKKEIEK